MRLRERGTVYHKHDWLGILPAPDNNESNEANRTSRLNFAYAICRDSDAMCRMPVLYVGFIISGTGHVEMHNIIRYYSTACSLDLTGHLQYMIDVEKPKILCVAFRDPSNNTLRSIVVDNSMYRPFLFVFMHDVMDHWSSVLDVLRLPMYKMRTLE
jgi:hypothetical protein